MLLNLMAKSSGGGSGTPLPQQANIAFRLNADSLSQADASVVTSWTDTGSWAVNFANASSVATFRTNQLNGKPCVRFTGVANSFLTASRTVGGGANLRTLIDSGGPYTVLIACRSNGTQSGNACAFGASAGSNAIFAHITGTQASSTVGRFDGGTNNSAPNFNSTNLFVFGWSSRSGYEARYLNGTIYYNNNATGPLTGNDFAVGASAQTGANLFNGDIFDIYVWNVFLTQNEIITAQKAICDKYALAYPWAGATSFDVYDGSSQTVGVGATTRTNAYPYLLAQSRGKAYGQWTIAAVGSTTSVNMLSRLSEWSSIPTLTGLPMKVAAFTYYNQRADSSATTIANHTAYINAVRALPNTKLAWGSNTSHSTDNPDNTRYAVNAYFDANTTLFDSYFQIHKLATLGAGGGTIGTAMSSTIGSNVVNFTASSTYVPIVGQVVTFSDGTVTFPAGTTITAINSSTQLVLSNNALATSSGLTITGTSSYATNSATYWSDAIHLNNTGQPLLRDVALPALNAI